MTTTATDSSTSEFMRLPDSGLPRVVVVGGGFAGINLIKQLRNGPAQVVLIDRNNFHQFQPLLYQVATCGLEPDGIVFPLRKLINNGSNLYFRMAEVIRVLPEENSLVTGIGKIRYDHLVLATGSDTNFFNMEDVRQNAVGMKDIREALDIRSLLLQHLEEAVTTSDPAERDALTNFVIVGGGPAGVEMAGSIAEFRRYILPRDYPELQVDKMDISLVEAGPRLLPAMTEGASSKSLKYLRRLGVDVLLNEAVSGYDGKTVSTGSGHMLEARTVIWTAGVRGSYPDGLPEAAKAKGGRLHVDAYNKVEGTANIYAVGDVALMNTGQFPEGHPMVAQTAIQQGSLLGKNLLRELRGKSKKAFEYNDKGSMATVGKRRAVADLNRLHFGGYFAWLLWSVVHLMSIAGFRNRLLVGLNWAWSYFTYEKGNRLIIRSKKLPNGKDPDMPVNASD